MPFTPFHFGPHTAVALPLNRYIDLPVFVLANVAIDIEPLIVMIFQPDYPLHGYCHTFLIGGLVGMLWGAIAWLFRSPITKMMSWFDLRYTPTFSKALWSGLLGVWLHIMFDAPLYAEMRPFWPYAGNPFLGTFSEGQIYLICTLCFIPVVVIYALVRKRKKNPRS